LTARPRLTGTDRRILSLAFPALGALAVEPLYVLVDTAIVGRIGTDELAGLALAATVLSFVVAGSNFLTYGTTERVARRLGGGDRVGAAAVGVDALWLSSIVGAVAVPVLVVGAPLLSRVLGGQGEVVRFAVEYLRISAVGIPFVLVTLAAQGVLRGAADYRTPLVVLVAANLANLLIELVFVFGFGWGVAGSAWSTVIAQAGAAVAFLVLVRGRLRVAASRRPDRAGLLALATAGRHLVLRVGAMLGVFGGATAIAARVDAETLAAHQVVMSLFLFLALALDALAVPAQTLVAERLGRNDASGAAHVAARAVRLSVIAGIALALALAALAPVAPGWFTPDPEVVERATVAAWFLAGAMVPGAVAFAYDGILIGAADYRFLGRAALAMLGMLVPVGAAILLVDGAGITAIWAALAGWMVVRAAVGRHRAGRILA
jgi:putative MATE family efflux protein